MDKIKRFLGWNQPGTALITGASAGIGETFVRYLAPYGFKFVLVARRKEKLEVLASDLQKKYGSQIELLTADLSTETGIANVEQRIKQLEDLDILINNAGFGTKGNFLERDLNRQMEMNIVHIFAPTRLCYSAIPKMVPRKRGVIINLSSLSVYAITKGGAVYSGSKAYLKNFTQALNYELKGTGIKFQALMPGFTYSEFHEVGEWQGFDRATFPKIMWMTKEAVVKYSLKKLKGNSVVVIPGFKNRLIKTLSLTPLIGKALLNLVNSSKQANSA